MKVLMVAPRICTPWSEGRKKFFRDLCQETVDRWQLAALITVDAGERTDLPVAAKELISRHAWQHLTHIRCNLRTAVRQHRPDLVCHLPFGEFSGLRGLANSWSIWSVERICKQVGVASCTLMYALTHEANSPLHRYILRQAYFNQHSTAARTVRFGVRLPAADQRFVPGSVRKEKNILFMAGVAEENEERLEHVLNTRGLRFLLRAGARLRADGYRLIVAMPLLRNERLLQRLQGHPDNCWEPGAIEYCANLELPDVYLRTHVFAFPYAIEELQFVPTSIVEAMHFSVPVIVPKMKFLAQFYKPATRALAYERDDLDAFVRQLKILDDPEQLTTLCTTAREFVNNEYNIRNSVTDIEEIYQSGIGQ